jgi:hypothetical protein
MRLTTNEKLIERQSKIARYAMFGGLAVLLGSVFITFTRDTSRDTYALILSYVALVIGFILAYVGTTLTNRWVKEPRADNALAKALKGLDNKYHLYNYVLPARHVLLTPSGLILFKVKSIDGKVECHGEKWSSAFRWSRLIGGMGQEPVGNPTAELRDEIAKMKALLAEKVESAAGIVPIDGYIVFTDPRVQLTVENPSLPVLRVEDLKDNLRKSKRGPVLPAPVVEKVTLALDETADAKTA